MPHEEMWSEFFNPQTILEQMQLTSELENVVDLGSGYGTFSIPAAQIVSGTIHAFDIEPKMIDLLESKADQLQIKNIELHLRDFIANGSGLADNSMDYVMLFNILHHSNPKQILDETYRILKPGAKAGIIHWRSDIPTPRGPALDIRPRPGQCKQWAVESGFIISKELLLEPFHFGIIIQKL
ncbi:MAG: class I SAM-dependent methyltransferase [Peptostreptococcaceae bacterium]|nr:class I SAM-dependent methyltransferase [Peptostreptococcaceae bacterium]